PGLETATLEAGVGLTGACGAQHGQEGLVQHVLRLGAVAEVGEDEAEQATLAASVERVERGQLADAHSLVEAFVRFHPLQGSNTAGGRKFAALLRESATGRQR